MTRDRQVTAALAVVLASCDVFLPSGEELTLLTEARRPRAAVVEILGMGVTAIVVKNGANGSTYYDAGREPASTGYGVEELDPTGAGDCFSATFVTCRLQGRNVEECLDYANAAGARAVTIRGPMEGTSTFAQLDALRCTEPCTAADSCESTPIPRRPEVIPLSGHFQPKRNLREARAR